VQPDAGFVSTKSRAEVRAELAQARQDGTLQFADSAYPVFEVELSKSREEVKAELAQAREAGTLSVADHEYPAVQLSSSSKTGEQMGIEMATAFASSRTISQRN